MEEIVWRRLCGGGWEFRLIRSPFLPGFSSQSSSSCQINYQLHISSSTHTFLLDPRNNFDPRNNLTTPSCQPPGSPLPARCKANTSQNQPSVSHPSALSPPKNTSGARSAPPNTSPSSPCPLASPCSNSACQTAASPTSASPSPSRSSPTKPCEPCAMKSSPTRSGRTADSLAALLRVNCAGWHQSALIHTLQVLHQC